MHRCVPDERRAASHAQWISGATGRSRIFCNLLDQKSDVDSRPQLTGRKSTSDFWSSRLQNIRELRTRIHVRLLVQKSDVDSRPQLTGRKFLDEDRISDS